MARPTSNESKKTIAALKEQISVINKAAKESGKLTTEQAKILNILRSQLKVRRSLSEIDSDTLDTQFGAREIEAQISKNILKGGKSRELVANLQEKHLNLLNQSMSGELDIADIESHRNEVNEASNELTRMLKNSHDDLDNTLQNELNILREQYGAMLQLNDVQDNLSEIKSEQDQQFEKAFGWWTKLEKKVKMYGEAMKTPKGKLVAMKSLLFAEIAAVGKLALNMKKFADDTGLSYIQMLELGPAVAFARDEAKALMDEFGGLQNVTTDTLIQMKLLNFQFGISGESAANLLGQMEAVSGESRSQLLSQIRSNSQLARAEGLAPATIMEDVASNTEFFAQFAKDGGDNIFKAAIEARKLGMSLSDVSSIADNLLDFESSIESQMKASVLLGRQINLDKARQLAFTGDTEGMMREIKNIVGSEAELNRMNVVQRKTLADAIGISVDKMAKMVREQEKQEKHADALAAIFGSAVATAITTTWLATKKLGKSVVDSSDEVANLSIAFTNLAKPAGAAIKSILGGLGQVGKKLIGVGKGAASFVGKFVGKGGELGGRKKTFERIPGAFGMRVGAGLEGMAKGTEKFTGAFGKGMGAGLKGMGAGLKGMAGGMEKFIGAFGKGMGAALKGLSTGLKLFANLKVIAGLAAITAALIGLGFALKLAAPGIKAFGEAVGIVVSSIGDMISKVIGAISDFTMRLMEVASPDLAMGLAATALGFSSLSASLVAFSVAGLLATPALAALTAFKKFGVLEAVSPEGKPDKEKSVKVTSKNETNSKLTILIDVNRELLEQTKRLTKKVGDLAIG